MGDLTGRADIDRLLEAFYAQVRRDPLLAPTFAHISEEAWPAHLQRIGDFWETVLFARPKYRGSPFLPHLRLGLTAAHFERWLALFEETLRAHFQGPKAEEALTRARQMATLFLSKIAYYQAHPEEKPLL
ncbi:MAG: group III truncated hemoglobin [Bacteroidia bacterium]|jgi:hemoglobin|nr:group III truncated hemoglobin [Bacteroidia bacterium]